jgi:hypothetical protein
MLFSRRARIFAASTRGRGQTQELGRVSLLTVNAISSGLRNTAESP